jgi:methionine aminotransferase
MITTKLLNIDNTIFTSISKMASDFNAYDLTDNIDYTCPPDLISLVERFMREGHNQYSPIEGNLSLRVKIAERVAELHTYQYDPESEITISAGATQALYTAITAIIKENDEVIVIEPAFENYSAIIKMNGGLPVCIQLKHPTYTLDWTEMMRSISARTKMIIINTPHNPTGKLFSEDDMNKLTKLVAGSKIVILSDEVFEHIVFDGHQHLSVAKYPELAKRSIIVSSFGKTFGVNGWNIGYVLAPADITKEYRKFHQYQIGSVNHPIQWALARFLENKDEYLKISTYYEQKRNLFTKFFINSKFTLHSCEGTYFQLINFSRVSDEKDKDFVKRLITDFGVATLPLSIFYHDKHDFKMIRVCFAKSDDILEKAAEKMLKIIQ